MIAHGNGTWLHVRMDTCNTQRFCAGSPFAQNMGSSGLPGDQTAAQGPLGADVALPAHLLTAPSNTQWTSTTCSNGFNAAPDVEGCCNGMQVMPETGSCMALSACSSTR